MNKPRQGGLHIKMAEAVTPVPSDECPVCLELLTDPRVLDCDHVFCTGCLETLETNKTITCPQCRAMTRLPVGLFVRHLPRKVIKEVTTPVKLVKTWQVIRQMSAVTVDDANQVIYIGARSKSRPIQMYSLSGRSLGAMSGSFWFPGIAIDTKRKLVAAAAGQEVHVFDMDGLEIGTVKDPQMKLLQDIAYLPHVDRYVVGDVSAHCLYYIDPKTYQIVNIVPVEEARVGEGNIRNLYMAANKADTNAKLATLDNEKGLVKLYDGEGGFIKSYGGDGSGYGQFRHPEGICFDPQGRLVVSDRSNQRLVRVSPDEVEPHREWQVLASTSQFGLGRPREIVISQDGLAVMAFYTYSEGPFYLAILSGIA